MYKSTFYDKKNQPKKSPSTYRPWKWGVDLYTSKYGTFQQFLVDSKLFDVPSTVFSFRASSPPCLIQVRKKRNERIWNQAQKVTIFYYLCETVGRTSLSLLPFFVRLSCSNAMPTPLNPIGMFPVAPGDHRKIPSFPKSILRKYISIDMLPWKLFAFGILCKFLLLVITL